MTSSPEDHQPLDEKGGIDLSSLSEEAKEGWGALFEHLGLSGLEGAAVTVASTADVPAEMPVPEASVKTGLEQVVAEVTVPQVPEVPASADSVTSKAIRASGGLALSKVTKRADEVVIAMPAVVVAVERKRPARASSATAAPRGRRKKVAPAAPKVAAVPSSEEGAEVAIDDDEAAAAANGEEAELMSDDELEQFAKESESSAEIAGRAHVGDYVRWLKKFAVALLTAEDEVTLAKEIEAGVWAEFVLAVTVGKTVTRGTPKKPEQVDLSPEEALAELVYERAVELAYVRGGEVGRPLSKEEEKRVVKNTPQAEAGLEPFVAAARKLYLGTPEDERDELVGALREVAASGQSAKRHFVEANLRLAFSVAKRYPAKDRVNGKLRHLEQMDIISFASTGLHRAVEKFDYTKGYKFSTYANWWIRQAIQRGIGMEDREIRWPVHAIDFANQVYTVREEMALLLGYDPSPEEVASSIWNGKPDDKDIARVKEVYWDKPPVSRDKIIGEDGGSTLSDLWPDTKPRPDQVVTDDALFRSALATFDDLTEREQSMLKWRMEGKTLEEIATPFDLTRERVRQIVNMATTKLRHPASQFWRLLDESRHEGPSPVTPNCDRRVSDMFVTGAEQHTVTKICGGCALVKECLYIGLSTGLNEQHGVFGGMTSRERQALLREGKITPGVAAVRATRLAAKRHAVAHR